MDRFGSRCLALVATFWVLVGGAVAAAAPPPGDAVDDGPAPLVEVPPGCEAGEQADVAFVGTVLAKDYRTVRFEIDQVRSRTTDPWAIDGLIDVRYGLDTQYLVVGQQYLVGAAVDPEIGVLASNVRPPEPLFGGNDVIGLEDTAVECPVVESGVRTLHVDGSGVESGVFSPMLDEKTTLFATIAIPMAVAFAAVLVLVVVRMAWRWGMRGVFELGRAAVTPAPDHRAVRVRSHGGDRSKAAAK